MADFAPLPHEWMLTAIIGFFVSWLYIYPSWSEKWGAAFMLFFIIVFIASIVSMSQDSLDEKHLDELAVHEKR